MWKWYDDLGTILAVVLTAAIVMLIAPASAEERLMGFHSQHHHGKLHHWYQNLMRPDNPYMSCCLGPARYQVRAPGPLATRGQVPELSSLPFILSDRRFGHADARC